MAFEKIRNSMPIADRRAAKQVQDAEEIMMQQRLKNVSAGQAAIAGDAAIQEGAALVGANAAESINDQQEQAQKIKEQAERDRTNQAIREKEQEMQFNNALEKRTMNQKAELDSLRRDIGLEIKEKTNDFAKLAGEIRFKNLEQMEDLALQMATDEEDLKDYTQAIEQTMQKDITYMRQAAEQFKQEAYRMLQSGEAELDRESYRRIKAAERKLRQMERDAKAKLSRTKKLLGAGKMKLGAGLIASTSGAGAAGGGALMASGIQEMGS